MERKFSPPQDHQVFISFRGAQLRNNFISYLDEALRRNGVNVFIDKQENKGEDISNLLKRIEESRIAIVVFSSRYTESDWCLREAVKIMERVEQGKLKVLPIFYKVSTTNVKKLKGEFGDHFRDREYEYRNDISVIEKWKKALAFISGKLGLTLDEQSPESDFIVSIVDEVLKMLASISSATKAAKPLHQITNPVSEKGATSHNKSVVVKPQEKKPMATTQQPIGSPGFQIRSKVPTNQRNNNINPVSGKCTTNKSVIVKPPEKKPIATQQPSTSSFTIEVIRTTIRPNKSHDKSHKAKSGFVEMYSDDKTRVRHDPSNKLSITDFSETSSGEDEEEDEY